jgi:putative FmdB family regulatory protein
MYTRWVQRAVMPASTVTQFVNYRIAKFAMSFAQKIYGKTMPTYEYKCSEKPEHRFTEIRGMNEAPRITECTECKKPVVRLFEVRGINFKGDGFYSTDKRTVIETPMGDIY